MEPENDGCSSSGSILVFGGDVSYPIQTAQRWEADPNWCPEQDPIFSRILFYLNP